MSSKPDYAVIPITLKKEGVKPQDLSKVAQFGLSPEEVSREINEKSRLLPGVEAKVLVHIYPALKKYVIELQPPSITKLLLSKANASEPSGDPAHKKIGNLSMKDVIEVAIAKKYEMNTASLKKAAKTVLGSARSIGLTVDGLDPKEAVKRLESGEYDSLLEEYEELWRTF